MNHSDILAAANERGFTIEGNGAGKLSGANLDFPRVHAVGNRAVDFEISWALAERIATGQTTTVRI
jgi:hypothetical protein